MENPTTFTIRPKTAVRMLFGIIAVLVLASTVGQLFGFLGDHWRVYGFVPEFDLDAERNIPTYFSTLLLLGASVLLGVIAAFKKRKVDDTYVRHWIVLAAIFLYLSVDEAATLHERLIAPVQSLLDTGGIFYFAWVIPAGVLVLLFAVSYLRFWLDLSRPVRELFAFAALLYVGGAFGTELIGGYYVDRVAGMDLTYTLITTVEETLEMAGIAVFIYALLDYLRAHVPDIQVRVAGDERAPVPGQEVSTSRVARAKRDLRPSWYTTAQNHASQDTSRQKNPDNLY